MKIENILLMVSLILMTGCSLDNMFQQPQVTVIGYELVGLPGENTDLLVECDIHNVDSHDGDVQSVNYTAVIEGVSSLGMTYSSPFTMKAGQTVRRKLPLTIPTVGAALLLDKLNAGKSLNFTVTGKFIADTTIGRKELTLNTSGTANVTVGYENFYVQPAVSMNESKGFKITSYTIPTFLNPNGEVQINVTEVSVSNKDSHAASLKKMIYTVSIEGVNSQQMTNTPSTPIPIAITGNIGAEIILTNMPVKFTYASLIIALPTLISSPSNYVRYTIVGTAQISSDLGSGSVDFYLPVNLSGSNTLMYQ